MRYFFRNLEEILCAGFLSVMVLLVIVNVFLRYMGSFSIFWAEEVSTICFVWATFVGASAVYKHKMDMGIDALVRLTSDKTQKKVRVLVDLILLSINGYIFYMSLVFTHISYGKPTAVLGWTSAVVNSSLIVGFGLITLHTFRFLISDIAEMNSKGGH